MKNKMLLVIFLLPLVSMAQQSNQVSTKNNFGMHQPVNPRNASSFSKLEDVTYRLIATRTDTFDLPGNMFNKVDSSQYLYNPDTTLYAWVRLVNDVDSGWINYVADYYFYDAQKRDTSDYLEFWDDLNQVWNPNSRSVNEYDANGNIMRNTTYSWDAGNFWKNANRTDNSFDANNNLIQQALFSWNGATWDSSGKFVNTYDANNNLVTQIYYYYVVNVSYPSAKSTLSYDVANNEVKNINQYYSNGNWKNDNRDTFIYDINTNLISYERRNWHSGSFSQTNTKYAYTYNGLNQLTARVDSNGDGNTLYFPAYDYAYQYDVNENLNYQLQQIWSDGAASFVNAYQYFYYYTADSITGINSTHSNNAYRCKLYPNPASEVLQISMSAEHESNTMVEVMDMLGQLVSENQWNLQAGDNTTSVDVSKLPAGVYSIRIINSQSKAQTINRFVKE